MGLGLNDLIDKNPYLFSTQSASLLQKPSLWSWKQIGPPFMARHSFIFRCYRKKRGQQMVTLDAQAEKN